MKLDGKVALITGATSGIGEACAELFAAEGAKVALVGSSDMAKAEAVAGRINGAGGSAKPYIANLTKVGEITKLVATVKADLGRIDILVNSAGLFYPTQIGSTSEANYDRMMDINLKGLFFCVQEVAPIMKAQGQGRIVNISSVAGLAPTGSSIAYAVAKAGLIHLTRCMAVALAPETLVNCVAPGLLEGTRATANLMPEQIERASSSSVLKKVADKEDCAEMVVTMCRTDTMTGQTTVIDAGRVFH